MEIIAILELKRETMYNGFSETLKDIWIYECIIVGQKLQTYNVAIANTVPSHREERREMA